MSRENDEGFSSMATLRCKTLTVSIDCPPADVYRFVSDPANLPVWATAFCRSVANSEGEWIVQTPDGPVRIRFVGANDLGVLDHWVSPSPGVEILVPMRVVPNSSGSEVMLTICQMPEVTDEAYTGDLELVERDLQSLKQLLEGEAAGSRE